MYDLHRLKLLDELRRRGTIAASAAALGYSPSTVSRQLAILEQEVGVPLFEPDGRRIRLTPQAEILAGHVERILADLDRARADVAASQAEVSGTVRLAAFQTAALAIVPAALERLDRHHPRLRVQMRHLETEDALPALAARELDLVIGEEYPGVPLPRSRDLVLAPLCTDRLWLALPPGAAPRREGHLGTSPAASGATPAVALAEAADLPWAMEPRLAASRQWAQALGRVSGHELDVRFETSDLLLQAELVRRGRAAAILPGLLLGLAGPGIRLVDLGPAAVRTIVVAVRREGATDPALEACRAALAASLPEGLTAT